MYPINDNIALSNEKNESITYQELNDIRYNITEQLENIGVTHGDRVGISMQDGIDLGAMFVSIGLKYSSVIIHYWFKEEELINHIKISKIRVLIIEKHDKRSELKIRVAKNLGIGIIYNDNYNLKLISPLPNMDAVAITGEYYAKFSSGTASNLTIFPNTKLFSYSSFKTYDRYFNGMTSSDRSIMIMAFFTSFSLELINYALYHGQNYLIPTDINRDKFHIWAKLHKPTYLAGGPFSYLDIMEKSPYSKLENSHIRSIQVSGGKLEPELWSRIEKWFDGDVWSNYSMSEIGMITVSPTYTDDKVSSGIAVDNIEIKIVEITNEILVRGDVNSNGEWFHTGDIGEFINNKLFITGRLRELIVSGGGKILPAEIEKIALIHPKVTSAVSLSIPIKNLVENPVMVVVANDINEKELLEYMATQLSSYKIPKQILFVDSIPKTEQGKISRKQLRNLFR